MRPAVWLSLLFSLASPLPVQAQWQDQRGQDLLPVPYPPSGGQPTALPPAPGNEAFGDTAGLPASCNQVGTKVVWVNGGYLCLPQATKETPTVLPQFGQRPGCGAYPGTRLQKLAGGYICLPR